MSQNSPRTMITQLRLNQDYQVIKFDLNEARTQEKMTLRREYNELSIMDSPAAFSIYLNRKSNDEIPIPKNSTLTISNFGIREIYIKNSSSGTSQYAYIWLAGHSQEEGVLGMPKTEIRPKRLV